MKQKTFFVVTAVIFLIIAVLHLLRLVYNWPAEIGNAVIPMWVSWIALLIAGCLSYFGFKFAK